MTASLSMEAMAASRPGADAINRGEARCASESLTASAATKDTELRPITLLQPGRILFGNGSVSGCVDDLVGRGIKRIFVVTSSAVVASCGDVLSRLQAAGLRVAVFDGINVEPTVSLFEECLRAAQAERPEGIIGLGGGSAMDVAKLVAALADRPQAVTEVFGINLMQGRRLFLACLPTTSGTGSEVSPNAILLDEACQLKRGVISPHLVPDVACVDPLLTCSMPPAITAATGLDALTHCIEAYANRFAHPMVDLYALQGIRLIAENLLSAIVNGQDIQARAALALGSLYGGMCLGPVNTAAVHALAYPLGSEFHIAHGISNAVLLPHVLRFNLPPAPERYAAIAMALGVPATDSAITAAERGIQRLEQLMARCSMPRRISEFGVPREALPRLAKAAMTVTRLLKNNLRPLTEADALALYRAAW